METVSVRATALVHGVGKHTAVGKKEEEGVLWLLSLRFESMKSTIASEDIPRKASSTRPPYQGLRPRAGLELDFFTV